MTAIEILSADTIRIERILDASPATVWRYLTESDLRMKWFAGGEMEPRVGGAVALVFDHDNLSTDDVPHPEQYAGHKGARGTECVVEYDPPHVLAFSWDEGKEGTARFELFEEGADKTRIVLTHSGITGPGPMSNFGGGWHSHLAVLQSLLAGNPVRNFWTLHTESKAKVAAILAKSSTS